MVDSSSSFHQSNHDVFIYVRTTFVDPLYIENRITVFKNDDSDESNASWNSIIESRFVIVIFSKSYGSSSRCLDELVKIMECRKQNELFVLPVYYYDFSPSNLRTHGLVFGELFRKCEMEKVRIWTSALVEAANLSGIGLIDYRYQEKLVKEIVEMVVNKLNIGYVNFTQNPMRTKHDELRDSALSHEEFIGIERRVQQVKELFKVEREELTKVKIVSNTAMASSSLWSSRCTYDVLMCFKGHDICKDFADQLHYAIKKEGIYVSSNNQGLARDESISSEHLMALEKSSIVVLIFSKNYVTDSCCLNELEKIMKCNEEIGQIVLPVFYDVDPSDVRNQKGLFGQSFMRNNPEKVEIWRKALVKVGSLAGWYLNCASKSHEATVIRSIVDLIKRKSFCLPSSVDYNLIGIELRMKHVTSLLKLESGGVHMLGMWGMGGIGKTTITRAVFDQLAAYFDSSCFIENIKEVSKKYGLEHIQKEVLSKLFKDENLQVRSIDEGINLLKDALLHHKVLYVLDDVDHSSQLEALVGAHNWFDEGSRIIITTRDENVLVSHNIMQIYYVNALNDHESSLFLRSHAFTKDCLTEEYEDLLPQVISYAAGLPLALKVLSSLLCGRSKIEWISILSRLEEYPEKAIQDVLKKSYDSLNASEKKLFLDVVCFFINVRKGKVIRILDSRGFSGEYGIRLLEQKSHA